MIAILVLKLAFLMVCELVNGQQGKRTRGQRSKELNASNANPSLPGSSGILCGWLGEGFGSTLPLTQNTCSVRLLDKDAF